MIEDSLSEKYYDYLIGLDIYENKNSLILSKIILKPEFRGSGIGTKIMNDLTKYADNNKQIIALTPSNDFGGNKNRLIQFYKKFGFKHNKGQYKSFEFRDSMIRYPKLSETMKNIKQLLREGLNTYNILLKENNNLESCDCCKYFDMASTSKYDGLENPLYFIFNKSQMSKIEYISPKQYIHNIARGFGTSYDDALTNVNNEIVKKYADEMKKGAKFPIGFYTDGLRQQEGRHRAMSLMLIGCNSMPVVSIRNLKREEVDKLALYFKDKPREEVDSILKNMGYNGMTNLDYKSLSEYIEHRL